MQAAKLVEHQCDAVDLNLGCPQNIAKRGHYGSFLQDEWDLIEKMVRNLHENLCVPVTCKIRIFPDVQKSIKYAKMLERAGCQLLTVHGRLREQKGPETGIADWEQIRLIKQELKIPVFANGNILYFEDVERCMQYTKVDGVMSAEGHLYNPAIFTPLIKPIWEMVDEYLDICGQVENADCSIRGHLFKMYRPCILIYTDLRDKLGKLHTLDEFIDIAKEFNDRLKRDAKEAMENGFDISKVPIVDGIRKYPHWILQPCIRDAVPVEKSEQSIEKDEMDKKMKRKERNEKRALLKAKQSEAKSKVLVCQLCKKHVASSNCLTASCKKCCLASLNGGFCDQHRPNYQEKKHKREE